MKNFSMTAKNLIVVTIIISLLLQTAKGYSEIGQFLDNMAGLGLSGNSGSNEVLPDLENSDPKETQQNLDEEFERVIIMEREHSEIVDKEYKELCIEILIPTIRLDISQSRMDTLKKSICNRVVLNSGKTVKNLYLGHKMVAIYVASLIDLGRNRIDFSLEESHLIAIGDEINSRVIQDLQKRRLECWLTPTSCVLTNIAKIALGSHLAEKWSDIHRLAVQQIETKNSLANGSTSSSAHNFCQRLLSSKKKSKRKKTATIPCKSKRESKEYLKAIARSNLMEAMLKMNNFIRTYNSQSAEIRNKIFKGIKHIGLEGAKRNCELKFGEGNCIQMNKVAYCYNCEFGAEAYWKTESTCGCKISRKFGKALMMRQATLTLHYDKDSISLPKNLKKNWDWRTRASKLAPFLVERTLGVKDAFFFEVEDCFNL